MRRYDEAIEVKPGLVAGQEAPAQFLWRNRLWMVRAVEDRWVETCAWWHGPAARAVRGDDVDTADLTGDLTGDVTGEREIWRVQAAAGRSGDYGVCELAHASSTGEWRLVHLMD